MDRFLKGDSAAEKKLFVYLQAVLRSSLRRRKRLPLQDEDDAVQEILLRSWQANVLGYYLEHNTSSGSLKRLLLWHARNVLRDLGRRKGTLRNLANEIAESIDEGKDGAPPAEPAAREPMPSANARASEMYRIVKDTLSDLEFAVWRLRVMEGCSFAEIGPHVGRTEEQVRPFYHRARLKLIRRFGRDQAEE